MPLRAHKHDGGLDLLTPRDVLIGRGKSEVIDTGVHVEIPEGCVGLLMSKSGLNVKHGITNEGVIDCGYTGSVVAKLYNNGDEDVFLEAGDKITQLLIVPVNYLFDLEEVDSTDSFYGGSSERGDNGFGSSGR